MATTITIIGMDWLGQSIGHALKKSTAALTVVAHDRDPSRAQQGAKQGAADRVEFNLIAATEGAGLVILNEPLLQLRETLEILAPALAPDTVVTDTASVKKVVLEWARELLPPHIHFVGSTPLVIPAPPEVGLFEGRRYAVVPPPEVPEEAVRLVTNFIALLGAEPLFIEVDEHDSLLAAVMQLPALTGAALVQLTARSSSWREMAAMAGTPIAAATRALPPDGAETSRWLRYNREPLRFWLRAMQEELSELERLLMVDDEGEALEAHLKALNEVQGRWLATANYEPQGLLYGRAMEEVKESSGTRRFFNFGRRKKE